MIWALAESAHPVMAAAATTAATHRHVGSAFFMIIPPSPSIFGVRCRGHFIATAMAAGNRSNSYPTSAAGHLIARLVRAKPPAGGGARTWEFLCAVLLACFVSPCEEYKQVEVSLATVVVRETAVSNPSAPPAGNVVAVLDPDRQKENWRPSPYKGGHVLPRGAYLG